LQLCYGYPNPPPCERTTEIILFVHFLDALYGDPLGIFAVLLDQQSGCTPNVEVGDHAKKQT
jgi:hypothetical protein